MNKAIARIVALSLSASLGADAAFADGLIPVTLAGQRATLSLHKTELFSQQVLIGRLAGMVILGKHGNPRAHQPVHESYKEMVGADTGGDLHLMSRMLRFLDKIHAKHFGGIHHPALRTRRIQDLVHLYGESGRSYEADLISHVTRDALQLLRHANLPLPRPQPVRIYLIDLPNTRHGRRFVRRYVEPEQGVRALHFEMFDSRAYQVIVMRREDLTAERLAHELGEIALMQRDATLHWTRAHNVVNAAGLGRGSIDLLYLPKGMNPGVLEVMVGEIIRLFNDEVLFQLASSLEITPTPGFIRDLYDAIENYFKFGMERDRLLNEIATEKEKENLEGMALEAAASKIMERMADESRHLPSDDEILRDTVQPVLVRHGVPTSVGVAVRIKLAHLIDQMLGLEGALAFAPGKPLEDLIDTLIVTVELSKDQALRFASEFARQLGWTGAQIAEALYNASLASRQNEIGASVEGNPRHGNPSILRAA